MGDVGRGGSGANDIPLGPRQGLAAATGGPAANRQAAPAPAVKQESGVSAKGGGGLLSARLNALAVSGAANSGQAAAPAAPAAPAPKEPLGPPIKWEDEADFEPTVENLLKGRCPPPKDLTDFVDPITIWVKKDLSAAAEGDANNNGGGVARPGYPTYSREAVREAEDLGIDVEELDERSQKALWHQYEDDGNGEGGFDAEDRRRVLSLMPFKIALAKKTRADGDPPREAEGEEVVFTDRALVRGVRSQPTARGRGGFGGRGGRGGGGRGRGAGRGGGFGGGRGGGSMDRGPMRPNRMNESYRDRDDGRRDDSRRDDGRRRSRSPPPQRRDSYREHRDDGRRDRDRDSSRRSSRRSPSIEELSPPRHRSGGGHKVKRERSRSPDDRRRRY